MMPPSHPDFRYRSNRPLWTLWTLFHGNRWALAVAAVIFLIKHSPVWVLPVLFSRAIAVIRQPSAYPRDTLWLLVGGMLALVLQNVFTHTIYVRTISRSVRRVECALRMALVRRLQELSMVFHHGQETGRLQAKVLRDVEAVHGLCLHLIETVLSGVVGLTFAVAVTLARDPRAVLLYAVIVPVAVVLRQRFSRRFSERNQEMRLEIEGMSARVSEMIDMIPITRAHGLEEVELRQVGSRIRGVQEKGLRMDVTNAVFQASAWTSMHAPKTVFLGVIGYLSIRTGRPPVEDVILFWSFFEMIMQAVSLLLSAYPAMTRGFESIRSIGEVLECPDVERNEGRRKLRGVEGVFDFESVSYAYPGSAQHAVEDLSLSVARGECVAFVGPSGAGKSTVMNLVIGFVRPTRGRILLDGEDMQSLDLRTYRRHIAVIPQETVLFSGSVRENITYGLEDVDDRRLREAIEAANVAEFLSKLPEGLATRVGRRGARLSGGQRQRIAIARALVRNPQVILFDEATSSLDVVSERLVQEATERLVKGRTTFIVAHRLSTVRRAGRIVVLQAGRVVEVGSHDALVARGGEYCRLRSLQV